MGLTEYLRVIWRRKWRILGVALVLAAIVYVRSGTAPDEYEAAALLAVTPGDAGSPAAAEALAKTYANLAETRPVVARAVESGDIDASASDARDRIEAEATEAGFLEVHALGPSPDRAERLATAIADALVARVAERQQQAREATIKPLADEAADVERQLSSRDLAADAPVRTALVARYQELTRGLTAARLRPLDTIEIVSPARASTEPVEPTPARDALETFAAALLVFSIVALVIEALSDRLSAERPAEEAARITSLPVLAQIPRAGGADAVEAFRTLRTSLMFMSTSERLRTLAIVSVDPGAGKTFVALNLAREAAALDVPVVVIDGDLRRPSIHDRLNLPRSPGLSEALATADPGAALSPEQTPGHVIEGWMRIIPSGAPVADPAGLFGGRAFRDALDAMTWAELVVVDTPAGGLFADALAIASQCDATLVVVDAQNSKRRAVRNLVENLRQVSAQPIGLVMNRVEPTPRPSYYDKASGKRRDSTQRATAPATS
ncbi:MAG TPA: Wzz/FepE/Etk N-terminal domain-containing protein [Acidimicrobiales bacterium]|jgi:polysaccharide biosynthesis transport protein|nr:Wzz/FepE/Etk N-terminal domain-containing protein [Acidimicrobiales bacterium]